LLGTLNLFDLRISNKRTLIIPMDFNSFESI